MAKLKATIKECDELDDAVRLLGNLLTNINDARTSLVLAGVGTFRTERERVMLVRMESRVQSAQLRLMARAKRARKTAVAYDNLPGV